MLLLVLLVVAAIASLAFAKNAAGKEDAGLTVQQERTSASATAAKIPLGLTECKTLEMLDDMTTETPQIVAAEDGQKVNRIQSHCLDSFL
uniref:Secreted protein n=1 Tax=Ditylenchus dipsaci TaxID=166011 RepID=A0A915DBU4_9BILA